MAQQWRVGIRGKQRSDIDIPLLIQAVMALGRQLGQERQPVECTFPGPDEDETYPKGGST